MSFKTKLLGSVKAVLPKAAPDSSPEVPAPDSPGSWIMLPPGKHTVDGVAVEVPDNGQLLAPYPVKPGRHVVDGKVAIAPLIYESK